MSSIGIGIGLGRSIELDDELGIGVGIGRGMATPRAYADLAAVHIEGDIEVAITSLDARFASPTMPMAMAMTM